MRSRITIIAALLCLSWMPMSAQQGKKGGAQQDARIDSVEARLDSVIAILAGHEGRLGMIENGQQLQNADRTRIETEAATDRARIEARLDSLIAALQGGQPPDTAQPPDSIPPATGDTAYIAALTATTAAIRGVWTNDSTHTYDFDIRDAATNVRIGVTRDVYSPYTFTVNRRTNDLDVNVIIQDYLLPRQQGSYQGELWIKPVTIPGTGAAPPIPPDTTQPPPSGGAVPAFAADIAIGAQPGPNEPPGFTQVDPTRGGNWDVLFDYGEHRECSPVDGRCFFNPSRDTDPSMNGFVLRNTWPTGFGDESLWPGSRGRSGGTRGHLQTPNLPHTQSYISVKFKFDPNIQLGPTGLKIIGVGSVRANMIAAWILALDNSHRLTLDNKIYCGDMQCPGSPRTVRTNFNFVGDVLYHMEVLTKVNSAAGVPDGEVTIWINNVQRLHLTDVMFYGDTIGRAGDARWVNGVLLDPIPSTRVPAPENWVKYDDLYTSTRP
jgi:hypothetical protein